MKNIFGIYMVLLVLLSSCIAGKNYERPTVELPQQWNNVAPSDTSIAGVQWRQFFKDPVLLNLIDTALRSNYDLQLAMRRIDEADAYVKQTRANYMPVVTAQATASTSTPSKNSLNGKSLESFIGQKHIEDYTLNLAASWEIDVWGKIKREKEAALASYLQSYDAARTVRTTLIANIASSYFNLLALDRQLDITRRNLMLSDTLVRMMSLQKAAGQVTQLAVEQTDVQRQTAAILVPELEQQIAIQENEIRILCGQLPSHIMRSADLDGITMPDSMSAGFPADIISHRPDVRAAEMALVAANANVGVAQASLYPSFIISGVGGLNAFQASHWFAMPASFFGTAAATVAQPILQHRQLKTNVEVAKVQREEAVIGFRQSVLNATGDVVNALVQIDKIKSEKQIASQQVDTLHKAIFNAQLLFKSGLADYLEVISTQSKLLIAELNLASVKRQELSAKVELYRALGGGWN
jgi:multidrug efflux system outer membrane protein